MRHLYRIGLLFVFGLRLEAVGSTQSGIITTYAGPPMPVSDGLAINQAIDGPVSVISDRAGGFYLASEKQNRIYRVAMDRKLNAIAGDGTRGFSGDGGPAISAQLNYPRGLAVDTVGNLFIADVRNHRIRRVTGGSTVFMDLNMTAGGVANSTTVGEGDEIQAGYASLAVRSGATPYGITVFRFKQNGVTVSEVGIPASPPTSSARLFIDYRSSVLAVPGRTDAGRIDINTGIAVVNRGSATASLTFTLRSLGGTTLSTGHGTLAAGHDRALFIDQLNNLAPDFMLPVDFQSAVEFGSLEISSDQPVSVLALRLTINQRQEVLLTTTPVADLEQPPASDPAYFPQFVDGGGYTTSLILLNTSNAAETGSLRILDDNGTPLTVNQVGGTADSEFKYSIPPRGAFRFQTDGSPADVKVGWAQVIPDAGTSAPVGSGVFSYNPQSVLITDSGIPAAAATTHARIYVDLSGNHNTGLAVANLAEKSSYVSISGFERDGENSLGAYGLQLPLASYGHGAKFASEFAPTLREGFAGVLEIKSETPFAALTLRSLYNERGDFLITTFPIADANQEAPSPVVFPRIVDGGGYVTEFILISPSQESSTTLNFYSETGAPLPVGNW